MDPSTAFYSALISIIATCVTALATIMLWWVTRTLARETERLANQGSRPNIVATIEPNHRSLIWADFRVGNFGNDAAYDINIEVSGLNEKMLASLRDRIFPFSTISVMRPGQTLVSYIGNASPYLTDEFTIKISWSHIPGGKDRHTSSYFLSLKHYQGMIQMGGDPLVELATTLKHFRDDWKPILNGNRRINANFFDTTDREKDKQDRQAMIAELTEGLNSVETTPASDADKPEQSLDPKI